MNDSTTAYYPLQQIRKVGNIPLTLFGLTMSEITLLIKVFGLSYIAGIILQVFMQTIFENAPNVYAYPMLVLPTIFVFIMKYINNNIGQGLIFFVVANLQSKLKINKDNKSILSSTKL